MVAIHNKKFFTDVSNYQIVSFEKILLYYNIIFRAQFNEFKGVYTIYVLC